MTKKYTVYNRLENKIIGSAESIDESHGIIFEDMERYTFESEDESDRFIFETYEIKED